MTSKEVLIYIILSVAGVLSIYALIDTRKSSIKGDTQTKIRNLIFYVGILLGVYGLFELIKTAVQSLLKYFF